MTGANSSRLSLVQKSKITLLLWTEAVFPFSVKKTNQQKKLQQKTCGYNGKVNRKKQI